MRIIAGTHRGRRISVPEDVVRPTPERVREALFSILGDSVRDARVLDAYSGSGALGFEALSRGAARVVFIEAAAAVAAQLRRTGAELGLGRLCEVLEGRTIELLRRGAVAGPFDLVLADPPYDSQETDDFLDLVGARGLLAAGGRVVLERRAGSPEARSRGAALTLAGSRRYGTTRIDFYHLHHPS